jgi:predicted transcriptional regulator
MQSVGIKRTDEDNNKIADELISLGVNRITATTLACLRTMKEVRAVDLERVAGLRQPEVSIAMRQLREKGWVSESDKPKSGKGRPNKIYTLNTGFGAIIESLEVDLKKKNEKVETSIKRLKALTTKKS